VAAASSPKQEGYQGDEHNQAQNQMVLLQAFSGPLLKFERFSRFYRFGGEWTGFVAVRKRIEVVVF
jgi:hypothetical protein